MASIRMTRLAREVRDLENCRPIDDDRLDILQAKIFGGERTPYENGCFKLRIEIPERYPFDPPRVRFETKIYHPNIDKDGRICLEILKTSSKGCWKPTFNIGTVLNAVKQLMAEPNPDDPLEREIAEELLMDKERYLTTAKRWTELYAVGDQNKSPQEMPEAKEVASSSTIREAIASPSGPSRSNDGATRQKTLFSSKGAGVCVHPLSGFSSMEPVTPEKGPRSGSPCSSTPNPMPGTSEKEPQAKSLSGNKRNTKVGDKSISQLTTPSPVQGKRKKKANATNPKKLDAKAAPKQQKPRYEELFLDDNDFDDFDV